MQKMVQLNLREKKSNKMLLISLLKRIKLYWLLLLASISLKSSTTKFLLNSSDGCSFGGGLGGNSP
jgi:hypothetical protein